MGKKIALSIVVLGLLCVILLLVAVWGKRTPSPSLPLAPQAPASSPASPTATSTILSLAFPRNIAYGDTGPDVLLLQSLLKSLGYLPPAFLPNGTFDAPTEHALLLFQAGHALNESGFVDLQSQALLDKVAEGLVAGGNASSSSVRPSPPPIPYNPKVPPAVTTSTVANLTPNPPTPPTAFAITGATVSGITDSEVRITVTTNNPASIQVAYGPTTMYGQTTDRTSYLETIYEDLTGLLPHTAYDFRVIATPEGEGAPVYSENYVFVTASSLPPPPVPSPPGNQSHPADTVPPTVQITKPANGASVSGTITILASASDDTGVVKASLYVDTILRLTDQSPPYAFAWNTASLPDGAHAFSVKAYDASGNVGVSPTLTLTTLNAPATLSASLIASPANGLAPLAVTLTATAGGTAQGPVSYTFYCNRADTGTTITPGANLTVLGTTSSPYTAKNLCTYAAPGTYTAKVIIGRGNASPAEAEEVVTVAGKPVPSPNALSPIIIHTSVQVAPGQAVGIYGWNFGTSSTTRVAIQPISNNSLNPLTAPFQLSLQDIQNNVIEGILPPKIPGDIYALWINNGSGWSSPTFINQAEVFWASEGEVYPGQPLRFFGRNFKNPTSGNFAGLQVNIVTLDGKTSLPAVVNQATDYTVDVTVPSNIQPGVAYTAEITNGAGGLHGWAKMEDQASFTAIAHNANIDTLNAMFGLHAAWVGDIPVNQSFNITDYGAVGDGVTDDTKAIQATLNAVQKAGGGIVNIPAGTYLASTLTIFKDTVLVGASPSTTQLLYHNLATSTFSSFLVENGPEIGMANISVINTTIRPPALNGNRSAYVTLLHFTNNFYQPAQPGIFLEHVTLQNADGNGIGHGYSPADVIIENSSIQASESAIFEYAPDSHVRIRNNILTNTVRPLMLIGSSAPNTTQVAAPSTFAWLEGNTFIGSGCLSNLNQVGCAGVFGTDFGEHRIMDGSASFQYIAGNTSRGEFGGPVFDDGEGLNFQTQDRIAYSKITSATNMTAMDRIQAFTPNQLIGSKIAIIGGTGIGQVRTITANTVNQITISEPWQVTPDATSVYTIDASIIYHNIIVDNNLSAALNAFAVEIYTKNYDNIVADNTIMNSEGINTNANEIPITTRADFAYFDYIANNMLTGASNQQGNISNSSLIGILSPSFQNDVLHGTAVYGDEYRNNTMSSIGTSNVPLCVRNGWNCKNFTLYNGINFSEFGAPTSYPFAQGVLVEGNTITNAIAGIHLSDTAYDTFLLGNNFSGNGAAIDDQGSIRTILVR